VIDRTGIEYDGTGPWYVEEAIKDTELIDFEVIGIYNIDYEIYVPDEPAGEFSIQNETELYNQIFMPFETVIGIKEFGFEEYYKPAQIKNMGFPEDGTLFDYLNLWNIYLLDDPRSFDEFQEAAAEILPEHWEVRNLYNVHGAITNSMDTMGMIADLILWTATGATVVILGLLIVLYLRDRRQEIGIYAALGEKKRKIIGQILVEVLVLAAIGFSLSLFSGSFISSAISNRLVEQNVSTQVKEDTTPAIYHIPMELMNYHPGKMTEEEMVAAYDTSLKPKEIFIFLELEMGVVLIATIVPIAYLLTLKPKEILL